METFSRCFLSVVTALVLLAAAGASNAQIVEPVFRWSDHGSTPRFALVEGADGNFYGITALGGAHTNGTVFRISPSGEYTLLHSFNVPIGGGHPESGLARGDDGNFYGTTSVGGPDYGGSVFRITPAGEYTVLHFFDHSNGYFPKGALLKGQDGSFYGTTSSGGAHSAGTVFRITPAGEFNVLYSFDGVSAGHPVGSLAQGSDGSFYGVTSSWIGITHATIFRISAAGEFKVLYSFESSSLGLPETGLVKGSDGNFYGTTSDGGTKNAGTVFRISATGEYTVLYSFDGINGSSPRAELIQASDGNFYGSTSSGGLNGVYNSGTLFRISPTGSLTILYSFDFHESSFPEAALVQGSDGNLYGTTSRDGLNNKGTIFRISLTGDRKVLYYFNESGGSAPRSKLVQGSDGSFYGTTTLGGENGHGTVFRVTAEGVHTVIHSFEPSSGSRPKAPLVQGVDGNFYGTTYLGGAENYGTIFRISAAGSYKVLHSFDYTHGANPQAGLVQGSDGDFYGTTSVGGANNKGTAFRINAGGEYAVLYTFDGTSGARPETGLIRGTDGNFYGSTSMGGASGAGTIFRINAAGTLSVLHSFSESIGSGPKPELIQGNDGYFYGTTIVGGANNQGTVFRLSAGGEYTVIYSFEKETGNYPGTSLVQGPDGSFYGTTSYSVWGYGSIFRLSPKGKYAAIHAFDPADGADPEAALIVGSDGNLWGTTRSDSGSGGGTMYRVRLDRLPVTLPVDKLSYASALLRAKVTIAQGSMVQFEYGTSPELSSPARTEMLFLPDQTDAVVSAALSDLQPGTTYYYRLRVRRDQQFEYFSEILSFTTGFAEPQATVFASKGSAVPGAGNPGSGIPAGATWRLVGVPALGSDSQMAFHAKLKLSTGDSLTGVFAGEPAAPVLVTKRGDTAPGISVGTVFDSFKDPVINGKGEVAFIGHAAGGWLRGKGRQGIWSNAGALSGKPEWLVALQGIQAADAPFGAFWKAFRSVELSDSGVVSFTATLERGRGGVTAANDLGLWQATPSGTSLLLRKGQNLVLDGSTRKVKSFFALPAAGSLPGVGRRTTDGKMPVRVTFHDGTQALVALCIDAEPEVIAATGDLVTLLPGGALFRSFGIPGMSDTGTAAFAANLARGMGSVGAWNDGGIFVTHEDTWDVIAREGSDAPGVFIGNGWPAKFTSVSDALINAEGQVAFNGTTTGSKKGIWWKNGISNELRMVVSTDQVTVDGVSFTSFRLLALPDGPLSGPVFTAKMAGERIRWANDLWLWAVDSAGFAREIVREGDMVEGKTVRNFTFLSAGRGSSSTRQLIYRASFTDGSQALVRVQLP